MSGKGDKPRPLDMDKAVLYCKHSRFKDRCEKCKEASKVVKRSCKHCEFVDKLFNHDSFYHSSNREYWLMTEVFSYLHGGDVCNGGKDEH